MGNRDIDQKRMLIAKCYELALIDCKDDLHASYRRGDDVDNHLVDGIAMAYLDRVIKAADLWKESERLKEKPLEK